jgi:hypothetical protein
MSKKKSDEPTKSKSKKSSKKSSAEITLDGIAAAPLQSLAPPKPRSAGGGRKKNAARFELPIDDIARRAYYIAERRRNLNLEGDELGDWVEAERQLRKEVLEKSS